MADRKITPKRLTLAWVSVWDFVELLGTVPEGTRPEDVKIKDFDRSAVRVGSLKEFINECLSAKKDSGYGD
jgi:hypothetical protein